PSFSVIKDLSGISIVGVNPVTNRLYFASGSNLQVLDGNNESLIATIPGGNTGPLGINTSLNRLYVSDGLNQVVKVIDGATNTVTDSFSLGLGVVPGIIGVDSVKNRIYVTGGTNLYVIQD